MNEIGKTPFESFQTSLTPQSGVNKTQTSYSQPAASSGQNSDTFEASTGKEPKKIGVLRLWFNRLSQEQIDDVNKTGRLPKNAKFRPAFGGGYTIKHNIFNINQGTRTLPAGYEVRKSLLGFTRVVPVDSEGLLLRKKQGTDKV